MTFNEVKKSYENAVESMLKHSSAKSIRGIERERRFFGWFDDIGGVFRNCQDAPENVDFYMGQCVSRMERSAIKRIYLSASCCPSGFIAESFALAFFWTGNGTSSNYLAFLQEGFRDLYRVFHDPDICRFADPLMLSDALPILAAGLDQLRKHGFQKECSLYEPFLSSSQPAAK